MCLGKWQMMAQVPKDLNSHGTPVWNSWIIALVCPTSAIVTTWRVNQWIKDFSFFLSRSVCPLSSALPSKYRVLIEKRKHSPETELTSYLTCCDSPEPWTQTKPLLFIKSGCHRHFRTEVKGWLTLFSCHFYCERRKRNSGFLTSPWEKEMLCLLWKTSYGENKTVDSGLLSGCVVLPLSSKWSRKLLDLWHSFSICKAGIRAVLISQGYSEDSMNESGYPDQWSSSPPKHWLFTV